MKKQNNWEKEFEKKFGYLQDELDEYNDEFFGEVRKGRQLKQIKSFIRRLLAQKEKGVREEIEEDLADCPSPKVPCLCDCHEEGKWCLKCLTGWHRPNLEMYFRNKLKEQNEKTK